MSSVRLRTQLLVEESFLPELEYSTKVGVSVVGSACPLHGRSVLIVEDEPLIALELHNALCTAGASILAATNIKDAVDLISNAQICAVIVDINLNGHDCSSVCAALAKRSIPFMFYTGYSTADPLSMWPHAPAVSKPAEHKTMIDTIVQLLPPSAIGVSDHGRYATSPA